MATSNTFSITAGVTSFACDFGATDKETIVLTISSTGAVISSNDYSVLGVAASATAGDITIEWDDAGDYVGETLIISKFTEIDTGSPSDAMLVNFTTSGTTNPTNIQNEFAHLYDIVGQITGGTAVGTYDIADIGTVITRLNDLADDIFTTTTNSGTPAIWDGTNTLSIGGDTNVQSILTTHETRLNTIEPEMDTAQSDILTLESSVAALLVAAGFPNPYSVAAQDVAITDAGSYFTGAQVEAVLQEIAARTPKWIAGAEVSGIDAVVKVSGAAGAAGTPINSGFSCRTGNVETASTTPTSTSAAVEKISTGVYKIKLPTSLVASQCRLTFTPFEAGVMGLISACDTTAGASHWNISFDTVDLAAVSDPRVKSEDAAFCFTIEKMSW